MDAFFTVLQVALAFGVVVLILAGPFAALSLFFDTRNKRIIRNRFSEAGLEVFKVAANRSSYGVWFKHGAEVHHIACQVAKGQFRWVGKVKPAAKVLVSALNASGTTAKGSGSHATNA
jgi:hypothetical protein